MVGLDGVDDVLALPVLPGQLHADLDMGALHLVVDGLAQVMEQARPLGLGHVDADLGGEKSGQLGHLDGVVEHVLAIAGAVVLAAQQLDQFRVQAVDVGLEHGALALGADGGVHLPLGLLHHLLDAGGVDAAVQDELFQGQPGDLPAHRVKAGHGDGLGGVVDDEVHAGHGLQRADVAALPADDAALHLVVGQGHHGYRRLGHMVGGAALDGQGDLLPGVGFGLVLVAGLDLLELQRLLVGDVVLQLLDEVALGLLHGQAGDLFQQLQLAVLQLVQLLLLRLQLGDAGVDVLLLALQVLQLAVQVLLLGVQPVLLALDLAAAVLDLLVELCAGLEDLLLGLHGGLPLFVLGALDGVVDDAAGLLLSGADLPLGGGLPALVADDKSGDEADKPHHDGDDRCDIRRHLSSTPPVSLIFEIKLQK